MADITARLIWYRLGEVAENVREYIKDEDVDVLDVLFGMWVLVAMVILIVVYGLDWLSKSRASDAKSAMNDQERWQRLKRQHSFFTMEERREAPTALREEREVEASQIELPEGPAQSLPHANCQWMNRVILWLYLNYNRSPQWVTDWLRSLNAELERQTRENEVRIELVDLAPGSLPPKILSWAVEPDEDTRSLFLRSRVAVSEVGFVVRVVKRRQEAIQRPCHILLRNFIGDLRITSEMGDNSEGIRMLVQFTKKPQMEVSASLPDYKPQTSQRLTIDFNFVKQQVVKALETSVTEINFQQPLLTSRGDNRGVDAVLAAAVAGGDTQIRQKPRVTVNGKPEVVSYNGKRDSAATEVRVPPEPVIQESAVAERRVRTQASAPSTASARESVVSTKERPRPQSTNQSTIPRFFSGNRVHAYGNATSNGSVIRPLMLSPTDAQPPGQASPLVPSPARSPVIELSKGQSILTKVIKVSGFGAGHRSRERDLSCLVEMDEPYQRHCTHPVRGSNTAFWDQSFVLELNSNSQRITFVVFEGDYQDGSVGRSVVPIRELMAHPSSRQIIPLNMEPPNPRRRTKDKEVGGDASHASQASITVEFLFLRPEPSPSLIRPATARPVDAPPPSTTPRPRTRPELNSQSSTTSSSSSTSESSSSSASTHNQTPAPTKPVRERPQRVIAVGKTNSVPHAIVITDESTETVVNSRDLAEFMSPPTTLDTSLTTGNASKVRPAPEVVVESCQMVEGHEDFQLRVQRSSESSKPSTLSEDPSSSGVLRDSTPRSDTDTKNVGRGRMEKPKKAEAKRSRSFGSRLRRTLGSGLRSKERSQSADRLSNNSLQPGDAVKGSGPSPVGSQSSLQKSKSSGLSGSFRKLFGGGKRQKNQLPPNDPPPTFSGGGLVISRSSPHLGPDRPTMSGSTSAPRPSNPRRQQHRLHARQNVEENSSYSSEGYMITQDFQERRDSYV